jgi:hypothetical protein
MSFACALKTTLLHHHHQVSRAWPPQATTSTRTNYDRKNQTHVKKMREMTMKKKAHQVKSALPLPRIIHAHANKISMCASF